jgi:hypothetical protein
MRPRLAGFQLACHLQQNVFAPIPGHQLHADRHPESVHSTGTLIAG